MRGKCKRRSKRKQKQCAIDYTYFPALDGKSNTEKEREKKKQRGEKRPRAQRGVATATGRFWDFQRAQGDAAAKCAPQAAGDREDGKKERGGEREGEAERSGKRIHLFLYTSAVQKA